MADATRVAVWGGIYHLLAPEDDPAALRPLTRCGFQLDATMTLDEAESAGMRVCRHCRPADERLARRGGEA